VASKRMREVGECKVDVWIDKLVKVRIQGFTATLQKVPYLGRTIHSAFARFSVLRAVKLLSYPVWQ